MALMLAQTLEGLEGLQLHAAQRCLDEHKVGVVDRKEFYPTISRYLQASGDMRPYPDVNSRGQQRQWCGDLVAWGYADDHLGIHPTIRRCLFPSTYRLYVMGKYLPDWNAKTKAGVWRYKKVRLSSGREVGIREWHKESGALRLFATPAKNAQFVGDLPWKPRAGDIGTVRRTFNRDGKPTPWGGHVVMITGVGVELLTTVEGNAGGSGPDGQKIRDGVVTNRRPVSDFETLLRPSLCDFDLGVTYI